MDNEKEQKQKRIVAAVVVIVVLVVIALAGIILLPKGNSEEAMDEKGEAGSAYAMESLGTGYSGSSKIDSFVGAAAAKGQSDPAGYMVDESTFLLDQSAVEEHVADYLAGVEATANAQGQMVSDYITELGYDSEEAMEEEITDSVTSFIKKRLCVYQAAQELGITVSEEEYQNLLPEYAARFGYDDPEEFSYVCKPGTIACEMLYDKTVKVLSGSENEQSGQ